MVFAKLRWIFFFVFFIVGGCSSQVSKQAVLGSDRGAIVMGIKGPEEGYRLYYGHYDPITKHSIREFKLATYFGVEKIIGDPSAMKYFMSYEKPGNFYISGTLTFQEYPFKQELSTSFYGDLITFEVKPGQIVYVGEFEVTSGGLMKFLGYNEEKAKQYISGFSNLKGEFITAPKRIENIKKFIIKK